MTSLYYSNITLESAEDESDFSSILNIIVTIISIVGCLSNMTITMFLKISKTGIGKMVIALSLMDLIFSVCSLFITFKANSMIFCNVMSFILCFGWIGSLFWTCCFAHSLFMSMKFGEGDFVINHYFGAYVKTSTVLTIIASLLSAALGYFSVNASGGCYHKFVKGEVDISGIFIFLLPLVASILFCGVCYIKVISKLKEVKAKSYNELLLYPLILIVANVPSIIFEIAVKIGGDMAVPPFCWVIAAALLRSQGMLNGLAYGLSRRIMEGLKDKCCQKKSSKNKKTGLLRERDLDSSSDARMSHLPPSYVI